MPQWGVRPPEAKPRRALYPSYGLLPSRGKRGLGVRSSPLHGFLFLSHGLGRLSQGLAGRRSRGSRGIHRWVRSGSLRDSRLHASAIPASRGGRLRHAGGQIHPARSAVLAPWVPGRWKFTGGAPPPPPDPTTNPRGSGGSGLGEVIGDRSGVHHPTGRRRFQAPS